MASTVIEQELIALEKQYWQAIKDKDADTAMRLSDDPCIITGAQGVGRLDRSTLAGMMKTATYTLNDFTISDVPRCACLAMTWPCSPTCTRS